jgi:hypothetical protein
MYNINLLCTGNHTLSLKLVLLAWNTKQNYAKRPGYSFLWVVKAEQFVDTSLLACIMSYPVLATVLLSLRTFITKNH